MVFWQPNNADFVIEQPTALSHQLETRVLHYSTPYTVHADNRILAIPLPE